MDRKFRFRVSGLAFFIILLLHLIFTGKGSSWVSGLTKNIDQFQVIITVASGFFIFFTTDFIGFIFSSIFQFYFNCLGGYNKWFTKQIGNLNELILNDYQNPIFSNEENIQRKELNHRWKESNAEQFLIYFFWHRPDGVSEHLNDWIERRQTAYFTSCTFFTAALISTFFSIFIICKHNLGWAEGNTWVLMLTIIMVILIISNGNKAKQDAVAVTELYIEGSINPKFQEILDNYSPYKNSDRKRETTKRKNNK